jgi:CelD/BcsL family acetyltransferase involved in cellulose biosynthesis
LSCLSKLDFWLVTQKKWQTQSAKWIRFRPTSADAMQRRDFLPRGCSLNIWIYIVQSTELITRVLTQPAELRDIAGDWGLLCDRCSAATPFQRPEWLLSWAEAFSPQNVRVVEVRSGGMLVGLAPLVIYSRGPERVLAFMGGAVSDYLDLLVDPQCEREVVIAILDVLEGLRQWTTLDLTDVSSSSVLLRTALAGIATPHENCSALYLPRTREELLQLLSKRQRANLRNARSRIQHAGGGQVELAAAETLSEFLDELFRLHASRWAVARKPGVLADAAVRAFHRKSAPELLARGLLRLYRLRLQQRTIAVVYTLFESETVFCYLQGYDPEFAHLSPGTHLMFSVMEDAVRMKMRKFDLLRGEESYKRHWRAQAEVTHRIQLPRVPASCGGIIESVAA